MLPVYSHSVIHSVNFYGDWKLALPMENGFALTFTLLHFRRADRLKLHIAVHPHSHIFSVFIAAHNSAPIIREPLYILRCAGKSTILCATDKHKYSHAVCIQLLSLPNRQQETPDVCDSQR